MNIFDIRHRRTVNLQFNNVQCTIDVQFSNLAIYFPFPPFPLSHGRGLGRGCRGLGRGYLNFYLRKVLAKGVGEGKAAAAVVARAAGNVDICQVRGPLFVVDAAAVAAPATFQRTASEVECCAFTNRDDLTAGVSFACLESAVERMTVEVDGHGYAFRDIQRAASEVDVGHKFDVRLVGDGIAQLLVG